MKTELLIANKTSGRIWDASRCTQKATWTTNRTGSPGTFTFTVNANGGLSFTEGDIVRFSVDGQMQFYGWVFTKSKDRWGVIEVTCRDRLRYFKANASYGYAIPSVVEEDQSCLDIIGSAVQQTLLNTGDIYVFYDDGNGVALQKPEDMISNVLIGDKSLLLDYTYKTDIDEQTYNSIKLARPNEDTGRADVFIAQDSNTIGRWGFLQMYQTIDGAVNDAQAKAQAAASLKYYNRRMRTLKVSSLGVPGLRAGQMVLMKVQNLGDINLDQYVLLEKVTHTWENDVHTMDFETLAI